MNRVRRWQIIFGLLFWLVPAFYTTTAQTPAPARSSTKRTDTVKAARVRSGLTDRPANPKFTLETDQRFFFLSGPTPGPKAFNIWGARTGLLFPAGFKAGIGFYLNNQHFNGRDLFPETSPDARRRLRYGMVYYEPFIFRKPIWEFSVPMEAGWGQAHYQFHREADNRQVQKTGRFIPLGLGLSFAGKLPPMRGFRATRWFGLGLLVGYRYVLKPDFPNNRLSYNGFYFSVGPSFFLDRFTDDFKIWRERRKKGQYQKTKPAR